MSLAYLLLIAVPLLALLFWAARKHLARQKTLAELHALLQAQAAGTIDPEEFTRRQAAVHAALLAAPSAGSAGGLPWRWLAAGLALLLVVFGALQWNAESAVKKADPDLWADVAAKLGDTPAQGQANSGGDLGTVAKRLADKLAADPNNGEGWALLGKTYSELHRYPDAVAAYAQADRLIQVDAPLLADWADAQVMVNDGKWDDPARQLVKRAVAKDGKHVKALALAGSEAFDRKDYGAAITFWKHLKAAAEADSMDARLADANIAEAEALRSGKKPAPVAAAGPARQVAGVVSIAAKFAGRVAPGDTLFVVAKALDGGPPLAVWRYRGNDFPIEFRLDDSHALMPDRSISQFPEVMVSARVSRSGNAEAAKGDLLSAPVKTRLGNTTLALSIDVER